MHRKANQTTAPATVPVTFILEDPQSLGQTESKIELKGAPGQSMLDIALDHHIELEHTCGGVCACSTCHIYVNEGMDSLTEAEEDEEDRVEEAPNLKLNSRLSCQAKIVGDGPITVQIPAWNRNAVKETPH